MSNMNKAQLINKMASEANLSEQVARKALNAFIDTVTDALSEGTTITLVGFGTFTVSHRAARAGRNPTTGAALQIPAMTVPRFKSGARLKKAVNE